MATSCFYALAAQHKYGFRIFHPWNTFIVLPSLCPATKIRPVHSIHWRQSRVVLKQTFLHQIKMGKYIGARWQIVTLWFVWNRKHRADTPCSFTPWQPSARPACFSCVTKHEPMGPLGQSGHTQDGEHFSSRAVRWQCTQYLPTATTHCSTEPITAPEWHAPACTAPAFEGSLLWQKGAVYLGASAARCYTLHVLPHICDVPNDRYTSYQVLPGAEIHRWGSPQQWKHLVGWKNAVL